MRIVLNGRKVGKGDIAVYFQNRAYFTRRGLTKRTVLHELYHHLIYVNDLELTETREERAANSYSKDFCARSKEMLPRSLRPLFSIAFTDNKVALD